MKPTDNSFPAGNVTSLAERKAAKLAYFNREKYGSIIRAARLKKGINQPELARILNTRKNYVSNWEHGRARPDMNIIPQLCAALGIRIAEFFGVQGEIDQLTPEQSAHIIRKHVPDGVAMLKKYNMPGEIIKIVQNHHGNGTVGYFYYEAMKQNPKTNADDFRYDGLPPDTKEGAIVMLADIVEAAVRSLDNPSRQDISEMVYKLIKARYDEGLLDAAPLNRQDLNVIAEAFVNIFDGVYHQRVKYPDIKIHGAEDDNIL